MVWYDPIISLHGCLVVFTGLHFFCKHVFRRPVWFVCFVDVFLITPVDVDMLALIWEFELLEGLGDC